MEPKDKVCAFEQAKKLIELNFLIDTERQWVDNIPEEGKNILQICTGKMYNVEYCKKYQIYPALDVAELGEILPPTVSDFEEMFWLESTKSDISWLCCYQEKQGPWLWDYDLFETESQARCAALIWLIENGHIKPQP